MQNALTGFRRLLPASNRPKLVLHTSARRKNSTYRPDEQLMRRQVWPTSIWDEQQPIIPRSVPHWPTFLKLFDDPELRYDAARLLDIVNRCSRVSKASTIEELIAVHWHYLGNSTNIKAINVLLDRAYQLERYDVASDLLKAASARRFFANRETWEIRIAAAAKMGDWTRAKQLYETSSWTPETTLGADGWTRLLRICLLQRSPTLVRAETEFKTSAQTAKMARAFRRWDGKVIFLRSDEHGRRLSPLPGRLFRKRPTYESFDQIAWVTKLLRPDMFPLKTSTISLAILVLSAQGKTEAVDTIVRNWQDEAQERAQWQQLATQDDASPLLVLNHVLLAASRASRGVVPTRESTERLIESHFNRVDAFRQDNAALLAAYDDAKPTTNTLLIILNAISTRQEDRFELACKCIQLARERWGWRQIDVRATCFVLSLSIRDALDTLLYSELPQARARQHRFSPTRRRMSPMALPERNQQLFKQVTSWLRSPINQPFADRLRNRPLSTCRPPPGSWADVFATEERDRLQQERLLAFQVIGMLRRLGLPTRAVRMPTSFL